MFLDSTWRLLNSRRREGRIYSPQTERPAQQASQPSQQHKCRIFSGWPALGLLYEFSAEFHYCTAAILLLLYGGTTTTTTGTGRIAMDPGVGVVSERLTDFLSTDVLFMSRILLLLRWEVVSGMNSPEWVHRGRIYILILSPIPRTDEFFCATTNFL